MGAVGDSEDLKVTALNSRHLPRRATIISTVYTPRGTWRQGKRGAVESCLQGRKCPASQRRAEYRNSHGEHTKRTEEHKIIEAPANV